MGDDGGMARREVAAEAALRFVLRDVFRELHADAQALVVGQDHDPRDPLAADAAVKADRRTEGDGLAMVIRDRDLAASVSFSRRDAEAQRRRCLLFSLRLRVSARSFVFKLWRPLGLFRPKEMFRFGTIPNRCITARAAGELAAQIVMTLKTLP